MNRRVGFVETDEPASVNLPDTIKELEDNWDVIEKPISSSRYDFLWTGSSVEVREKEFLARALTINNYELPSLENYLSEPLYVADSALKVLSFILLLKNLL